MFFKTKPSDQIHGVHCSKILQLHVALIKLGARLWCHSLVSQPISILQCMCVIRVFAKLPHSFELIP